MAASAQRAKVTQVVPLEMHFGPFKPKRNSPILSDHSRFQRFSSLETGLLASTRKALPCSSTQDMAGLSEQNRPFGVF